MDTAMLPRKEVINTLPDRKLYQDSPFWKKVLIMNAKKIVAIAKHIRNTNIKLGSLFPNTADSSNYKPITGAHNYYVERMKKRCKRPLKQCAHFKKPGLS